MKKNLNGYSIDHIDGTIILSKKFAKAGGVLNSAEYRIIKQLRKDYPDYTVIEKEIHKKEDKKSYAKLTIEAMRDFIVKREGEASDNLTEFDKMEKLYEKRPGKYGYMKHWFLKHYGEAYNDPSKAVA